jgi:hypothetical protein
VTISPEERAKFERQVESLREIDDAGELSLAQVRAELDETQDDDSPPELELHRRAIALGMVRRSR